MLRRSRLPQQRVPYAENVNNTFSSIYNVGNVYLETFNEESGSIRIRCSQKLSAPHNNEVRAPKINNWFS